MKNLCSATMLAVVVALLVAPIGTADAAKKPPSHKGQAGMTFVNTEAAPAYGLHVTLSGKADVVSDPATGEAGPFRNLQGNGTNHVILTNPREPVAGEGEGKVDLTFRSYDKKLKVTGWWWVDQAGKRTGQKKKP